MLTHALVSGSPAIDAGDPAAMAGTGVVPLYDQRGMPFSRVVDGDGMSGARIDMGSYERQESAPFHLIVDTLTDELDGDFSGGDFSLREALAIANVNPDADTISFTPSLSAAGPAAIVLTMGELAISDAVTIIGAGADLLTIDARGNDATPEEKDGQGTRIFHIDDGTETLIEVTISGLTLTGGDVRGDGGAILTREELTILDCSIVANATSSFLMPGGDPTGDGGGIANRSGTLAVVGSVLRENRVLSGAHRAGGISSRGGSVSVVESLLIGNSGAYGGGIAAENGLLEVIDSSILENSLVPFAGEGGGIWAIDVQLSVINSTIAKNGDAIAGGGIFSSGGTLEVIGSTIAHNESFSEGAAGIHRETDAPENSSTVIRHSTIVNNSRQGTSPAGNGLTVIAATAAIVSHSIIAGNASGRFIQIPGEPFPFFVPIHEDVAGTVAAEFSLIGDNTGATIIDGGGNLIGTTAEKVLPMLAPLVYNGGPLYLDGSGILTLAPQHGSPAIDAGDPTAVAGMDDVPLHDQRGMPFGRIANGDDVPEARIDIGALEWQPNPLPGDYNYSGVVDAADFVLWRKTLGSTDDLRADGDGDADIDQDDYGVWRANFGAVAVLQPAASAVTVQHPGNGAESVSDAKPRIPFDTSATTVGRRSESLPVVRQRTDKAATVNDEALLAWLAGLNNDVGFPLPSTTVVLSDEQTRFSTDNSLELDVVFAVERSDGL
jgi:hypothetical protein